MSHAEPSVQPTPPRVPSVLIVGASMAGLSAAAQLSAIGYATTVIERSPHLRLTGSPIDVRGEALATAEKLGILHAIRSNRVQSDERTVFTTFVGAHGEIVATLPLEMANDSDDDVEIAREALVDIMHAGIDSSVEFVYRDWPISIDNGVTGATVVFSSGMVRTFDLIVGADGIHSSVRRLVIGPESDFRTHLGVYYAIVDLPPGAKGLSNESRTYNTAGRMVGINDYGERCYGIFAFLSPELDYDYRDLSAQKQLLIDAFAGETGWHIPYLVQAVRAAADLYFDSVSQVRMPEWSRGRVVLVGDAAHAASLFSGRGTSLAMLGAEILAEELAAAGEDYSTAFAKYEARLRPTVVNAQEGVLDTRDLLVPATNGAVDARNDRFASGRA